MNTNKWMLSGLVVPVVFMAGCIVTSEPPRVRSVIVAPPLPSVVVFETEPYYVYQGYHYHYQHDRWYYSRSQGGPWTVLPRECYPREVRYRDGGHGTQIIIAPPLPPVVVFETEPYYVYQGYHYHYRDNGWYYSRSKSGPWVSLPRDRYPREVKYRDGRHGPHHSDPTPHLSSPKPEPRDYRVVPQKEMKPVVPPPVKRIEAVDPRPEHKTVMPPPVKRIETVEPKPERKTVVPSPVKRVETVEPKPERKTVEPPVLQKEVKPSPPPEVKTIQTEKPQNVKPSVAGRMEKANKSPSKPSSKRVMESKGKEDHDKDGDKKPLP